MPSLSTRAKETDEHYIEYIDGVAETYDISSSLIQSMIFYESSWNTSAISTTGTHIGLMQVSIAHKDRMKNLGVTDLTNGYQNILVGVDLLAEYLDEYQNTAMALDAYNGCLHQASWYEEGNMTAYSKKILKLAAEIEKKRAGHRSETDSAHTAIIAERN